MFHRITWTRLLTASWVKLYPALATNRSGRTPADYLSVPYTRTEHNELVYTTKEGYSFSKGITRAKRILVVMAFMYNVLRSKG